MILEDESEVKTYVKKDISNVIEDLERFRHDQILQDKRNKLIENYTPERLDYLDQVAVSIARFENRIVSVSTLFHIPLYFNASRALTIGGLLPIIVLSPLLELFCNHFHSMRNLMYHHLLPLLVKLNYVHSYE